MGLVRNLSADEILSQVVHGMRVVARDNMPPLNNVVFMGMGDAGRNIAQVQLAVAALSDMKRFRLAASKITVSTVGPSPDCFLQLAQTGANIAWSLHSPDVVLRQKLIPSSRRHSPMELRDALVHALIQTKPVRRRSVMIATTLISGVNDSTHDAERLAEFVLPMHEAGMSKVIIDIIPYNDIKVMPEFIAPTQKAVDAFQNVLTARGLFCAVRESRGEEDSAACGMLATERIKKQRINL